jgi:hypothetical protein
MEQDRLRGQQTDRVYLHLDFLHPANDLNLLSL